MYLYASFTFKYINTEVIIMALDKMSGLIRCKYKIEVTYLNLRKNKNTKLRESVLRSLQYSMNMMRIVCLW